MNKGLLIVVSAPAGCGKDTILQNVFENNNSGDLCADLHDLQYSVSATTRQIREGEQEGVHYFFKSRGEFETMIENHELLEFTQYAGNYYGTPKDYIRSMLKEGKDVVLKIEVEGAKNIKFLYPDCVLIFIMPPSLAELERRLQKRGTEDADTIKRRIDLARHEMLQAQNYDYIIINKDIDKAVKDFSAVITAEKLSAKRSLHNFADLTGNLCT